MVKINFLFGDKMPQVKVATIVGLLVLLLSGYSVEAGNHLLSGVDFQQSDFILKGRITNEQGEPLAGVTIVLIGSTRTVTTDADGTYLITDTPGDKLSVSFAGMKRRIV